MIYYDLYYIENWITRLLCYRTSTLSLFKSGRFPIFGPVQSSMEKLLKENSRYEAELRDHYFVSMPSVY